MVYKRPLLIPAACFLLALSASFADAQQTLVPLSQTTNKDATTISVSGGYAGDLVVSGTSVVNVTGGVASFITSRNSSTVAVWGGKVDYIFGEDDSTANVSGGRVADIAAKKTHKTMLSKGHVELYRGCEESKLTMTGGSTGSILLRDNSTLVVYGTHLSASALGKGRANFIKRGGGGESVPYTLYAVSGTLQSGEKLNRMRVMVYQGTLPMGNPEAGTGRLQLIAPPVQP